MVAWFVDKIKKNDRCKGGGGLRRLFLFGCTGVGGGGGAGAGKIISSVKLGPE